MKKRKVYLILFSLSIIFSACKEKPFIESKSMSGLFYDYVKTKYKDSLNVNWSEFNLENKTKYGRILGINNKKDSLEFIFFDRDSSLIYYITPEKIIFFERYNVTKNDDK